MRKLCLQDNELTSVPSYLLELQNLCELILAKNKLTNLPECQQWSSSLIALDLSQNRIVALPANIRAARIRNLNLASNELTSVPLCICNFLTLQSLDLSDNKDIQTLPVQMGRLKELMELNLTGLKKLREPPKDVIQNAKECIQYLGNKLYSLKPFYRIKLVIVGMQNRGKTTLAAKLQGRECGNESTVGVDISEWEYKPTIMKKSFTFNVWDFGGQEEYYATHQCFMSECSMYLLVFSLTSGDIASEEVQSWLTNISLRAPGSSIHIVGTHLDEVPAEQRDDLNILLHKIGNIAAPFSDKLQIIGIFAVGLRNELENVNLLKESIYKNASEYKFDDKIVMGQMVPASYHILDKCLSDLQKSARRGLRSPIMDKEEYKTFIRDLNLDDIQNEDELNRVSRFLTNIGTILHFEDRSHSLDKLYFVDPLWLCTMMSKIITVKEKNPFVNNGIMELSNIPHIFRDDQFPMQYFDQYLALLDRFEVALVLDKGSLLIPSMLSDIRPRDLDSIFAIDADEMIFTRYIVFDSLNTPPGFWSRLISRIMHAVPQVQCVMDKNMCVEKGGEITSITKGSIVLTSNSFNQDSSLSSQLDVMEVQLQYWRTGIVYRDRDVAFKVESLINSQQYSGEGVLIMASSNIFGRKIFGQLIDLATSLFQEWYRGGKINQICPCIDCKKERTCPLAFIHIDQCLQAISKNTSTVKCDNHHFVRLCDLVPDLLLLDINPKFILQFSEIECENNDSSLLGMGAFSKVYLGQYHGQPVAVKVYQDYNSSVVLEDLRREAMLLQRFHHPCLVCLVGICTHPKMMLVLEEAPLGSLEKPLLKTKQSIHRVVIHRIVAQVAAALKLLHSQGIIYRDLKAANILLWSLDPESLCHCKVSDLGVAIHETPIGARGIQGTRGFIAPEVLLVGKKNQSIVYDRTADIFSFGMLIYQAISRRNPFETYKEVSIDSAIINGERPTLKDAPLAEAAFFLLTELMQSCWNGNPRQRPATGDVIDYVCLPSVQSIMCMWPLQGSSIPRQSCLINRSWEDTEGNMCKCIEAVICIENNEGFSTDVSVFSLNAMGKSRREFTIQSFVGCMCSCGDLILMCPRAGTDMGKLYVLNVESGELKTRTGATETVSCLSCTNDTVYCGTVEGSCFSLPLNIQTDGLSSVTHMQKLSDHCIDSVVVTSDCLWVSHTHHIRILEFDNLAIIDTITGRGKSNRSITRSAPHKRRLTNAPPDAKSKRTWIGQMKLSFDGDVIWSSHMCHGSSVLAWNVKTRSLMFDVDVEELLIAVTQSDDQEVIISAMTLVLDTVWVGTTSGHILVIHNSELVLWFHPYSEYVRFLECIHSKGPCETEEAIVVSGAKGFKSPVIKKQANQDKCQAPLDKNGMLIFWEAFPSKLCRQIKMIENESSSFLSTHETVKEMALKGQFKDVFNLPN